MKWPSWLRGPLRATPGTAVTGIDQKAVIMRTAQSIWDRAVANGEKMRQQDALWKYTERESYVCLAKKCWDPRLKGRPFYEVATVTDVPGCGMPASARGWTIEAATVDLRFRLAQLYTERGAVRDFDEARERAAKVELIVERSFALGSRGELA